jgi:hypothetical protein
MFESRENGRQNAYYVPEFEAVVGRYHELESKPTALQTFKEEQQAIASQMMKVIILPANLLGI